ALDVHREVAVAETEPGLAAELLERAQEATGLGLAAPAADRAGQARQVVHHGVEVGCDVEAEVLEVVAGVGDHDQPLGRHRARETDRELGAAASARERQAERLGASSTGLGLRTARLRWRARAPAAAG